MAQAKNKKKAVKKAAPQKAKKAVAKKKQAKAKRKQPKAKPVVKKVQKKVAVKKKTAVKKKVAAKKPLAKKAVKKVAKKVVKKVIKKAVKKAVKKTIVKKAAPKKKAVVQKKAIKTVAKKTAPKKVAVKTIKTVKQNKPVVAAKKFKPEVKAGKSAKPLASKQIIKPVKDRNEFDKKMELKAQRIMKELEERMDISKVKPRISVGTTVPKQKPAPVVVKLPEPENTTKEKFQMEFELRSSRNILFYYLRDSSGLAGWFADDVNEKDGEFTFTWEGSTQVAKLVAEREHVLVRFQWLTDTDGTYFQFEIKEDDITGDIALVITDWANPGERDSNAKLWEAQVLHLRQLIGS